MAIHCSHCGTTLPRDDARFCNNCGQVVPAVSPPVQSPASEKRKTALREQRAELPAARADRYVIPTEPPAWMQTLDRSARPEKSPSRGPVDPADARLTTSPAGNAAATADSAQQSVRPPEMPGRSILPAKKVPARSMPVEQMARLPDPESRAPGTVPANPQDVSLRWPSPITHVSVNASSAADDDATLAVSQEDFPHTPLPPPPGVPSRELRVKVWDQEDSGVIPVPVTPPVAKAELRNEDLPTRPDLPAFMGLPTPPARSSSEEKPVALVDDIHVANEAIDDLPTLPELAALPPQGVNASTPAHPVHHADDRDIEHFDTVIMPQSPANAPIPVQSEHVIVRESTPAPALFIQALHDNAQQRAATPAGPAQPQSSLASVAPVQPQSPQAYPGSAQQNHGYAASDFAAAMPMPVRPAPTRARRRSPAGLLAVVAILLLGLGIVIWVIVAQPFSASATITAQQSFNNEGHAGFSLLYPSDWQKQVDQGKALVHFADSTQTDQTDVAFSAAANTDPAKAVQKQAGQLGMTSPQTGVALTFGGASWQQLKGDVLVRGASYHATLLATVHGNHLYVITHLAPKTTYTTAEDLFFAPMRQSWTFA